MNRKQTSQSLSLSDRLERAAPSVFILPAVLVVLLLSIFPLVLSLYLSLVRLKFEGGGLNLQFIGLENYRNLLIGSEQKVLFGVLSVPSVLGWIVFAVVAVLLLISLVRSLPGARAGAIVGKVVSTLIVGAVAWLVVSSLFSPTGRPGALMVTLLYVVVGITLQYLIGLGLALLCVQQLPFRRFFRIVFLLPMMITPVGVGYLFRMLADTGKGPFYYAWVAMGLKDFSWASNAWGARSAVIIGDVWQWTPFMFIVLVAALEAVPIEPYEAALVDGATGRDIFFNITLPAILPVSTTLILIRMIEAFKIIDLPNILTNGGPGTATETLTLYSYRIWRALDVGGSAAIAYILLFVVTVVATAYVNFVRSRFANIA